MEDTYNHEFIETNGVRLHVVQAGPEDGCLVILLHGFPEFWRGWKNQIDPLAEAGYRVVVPDQRGYNLSDKPRGVKAYQVSTLAADAVGLMDALGCEKARLIGHDWGAVVAWEVAIHYPQRLEKLAILNVPHPDVMQKFLLSNMHQVRKSWYIFFFQIPGLPEWSMSQENYASMRRMMKGSGKAGTFSNAHLDEYVKAWSQTGTLTAMVNWYRAAFRGALRGSWNSNRITSRRVSVPTLMLWGKRDVALGFDMAQPSIDLCDDGRLVFFDDASHWVQHDKSEEVNEKLIEFLP
jgi:pimeloyl-ACP methyl ester carboxylesterase